MIDLLEQSTLKAHRLFITLRYMGMLLLLILMGSLTNAQKKIFENKVGTQWSSVLDWTITNCSYEGNPFDIEARAVFFHQTSGRIIKTPLFYNKNDTCKFRFTGVKAGEWKIQTYSQDKELNGWTRKIDITENENAEAHGFMKAFSSKWGWQGSETALIRRTDGLFRNSLIPGKPSWKRKWDGTIF